MENIPTAPASILMMRMVGSSAGKYNKKPLPKGGLLISFRTGLESVEKLSFCHPRGGGDLTI